MERDRMPDEPPRFEVMTIAEIAAAAGIPSGDAAQLVKREEIRGSRRLGGRTLFYPRDQVLDAIERMKNPARRRQPPKPLAVPSRTRPGRRPASSRPPPPAHEARQREAPAAESAGRDDLIRQHDAAVRAGVTDESVRQAMKRRGVERVPGPGNSVSYPRAAIEAWIADRESGARRMQGTPGCDSKGPQTEVGTASQPGGDHPRDADPDHAPLEQWISMGQAAEMAGVSKSAVGHAMRARGVAPYRAVGSGRPGYFARADIEAWIASRRRPKASTSTELGSGLAIEIRVSAEDLASWDPERRSALMKLAAQVLSALAEA